MFAVHLLSSVPTFTNKSSVSLSCENKFGMLNFNRFWSMHINLVQNKVIELFDTFAWEI